MYHVPGLTLVAEGIDGASRDAGAHFGAGANVDCILGPAVPDELWQLENGAAMDAGGGRGRHIGRLCLRV
jgi:hypothetical protein